MAVTIDTQGILGSYSPGHRPYSPHSGPLDSCLLITNWQALVYPWQQGALDGPNGGLEPRHLLYPFYRNNHVLVNHSTDVHGDTKGRSYLLFFWVHADVKCLVTITWCCDLLTQMSRARRAQGDLKAIRVLTSSKRLDTKCILKSIDFISPWLPMSNIAFL